MHVHIYCIRTISVGWLLVRLVLTDAAVYICMLVSLHCRVCVAVTAPDRGCDFIIVNCIFICLPVRHLDFIICCNSHVIYTILIGYSFCLHFCMLKFVFEYIVKFVGENIIQK